MVIMDAHVVGPAVGRVLASGAGNVFGPLFAVLARLRPAAKPLHPKGIQFRGTLYRSGSHFPLGVPWLDESGSDPVLVRLSRSIGLPESLPDIHGLALRIERPQGCVDVLFATTGQGKVSRFLLTPRLSPGGAYSTLMPYRAVTGPIVLLAFLDGDGGLPKSMHSPNGRPSMTVRLSAAIATGPWREFGHLQLTGPIHNNDSPVSFDPILHQMSDLPNYQWAHRIRAKAYSSARTARNR